MWKLYDAICAFFNNLATLVPVASWVFFGRSLAAAVKKQRLYPEYLRANIRGNVRAPSEPFPERPGSGGEEERRGFEHIKRRQRRMISRYNRRPVSHKLEMWVADIISLFFSFPNDYWMLLLFSGGGFDDWLLTYTSDRKSKNDYLCWSMWRYSSLPVVYFRQMQCEHGNQLSWLSHFYFIPPTLFIFSPEKAVKP